MKVGKLKKPRVPSFQVWSVPKIHSKSLSSFVKNAGPLQRKI